MKHTVLVVTAIALAAHGCGGSATQSGAADAATADAASGDDAGAVTPDGGAIGDAGSPARYDHDGPEPFTTTVVKLSNAGRTWNEAIYAPTSAGPHPVVSIGCGTQQVNAAYDSYARRLASYGIIALVQDDPGALVPTPNVVDDLVYVITSWLPSALPAADVTAIGLSGHSRGGKASLLAVEHALKGKVKAWFGLDPVDADFLGTPGARGEIGTVGIPIGFAGATVSSNCSPASANYQVYYAASTGPAVAVTIQGAGHMQLLDESKGVALSYCTPDGTADASKVLATAVHYMTAFFARELLGDASVGPAFAGAGAQADIAAGRVAITSK